MYICKECINESYLSLGLSDEVGNCFLCGGKAGLRLTDDGIRVISNYIILNYPLLAYYKSQGGWHKEYPKQIGSVLERDDNIIKSIKNDSVKSRIVERIKSVSHIGCEQNISNYFVEEHMKYPLKDTESKFIKILKKDIYENNFYVIFDKYKETFEQLLSNYVPIYDAQKSKMYYRARIGSNVERVEVDDLTTTIKFSFIGDEISAAPPYLVGEGRFNRKGCSYLYVASDMDTAISEVRPEPGDTLSLAKFKINTKSNYIDLRSNIKYSIDYRLNIEIIHFFLSLSKLFSKPVTTNKREEYLVTQFISELLRIYGFHGIVYDSPQNKGYNILSFYPEDLVLEKGSEEMRFIEKVTYTHLVVPDERFGWDCDPEFESEEKNEKYG
jgi:hypothetical protein